MRLRKKYHLHLSCSLPSFVCGEDDELAVADWGWEEGLMLVATVWKEEELRIMLFLSLGGVTALHIEATFSAH